MVAGVKTVGAAEVLDVARHRDEKSANRNFAVGGLAHHEMGTLSVIIDHGWGACKNVFLYVPIQLPPICPRSGRLT